MGAAEPFIEWPQPLLELLGFIAAFLTTGAVGYRLVVMRAWEYGPASDEGPIFSMSARRAALLGLLGALIAAVLLGLRLPELAASRHVEVPALILSTPPVAVNVALKAMALLGFLIALTGWYPGWVLAAIAVLAGAVRNAFFGQWGRLANPLHELGAALWIGTLLVLVLVGIRGVLASRLPADRRGELIAQMVRAFSPLALAAAVVLAIFGVTTAWRHLHTLEALWTTPYGWTLIGKLTVVLGVVMFGAWNWKRQTPKLGTDAAAENLERSAIAELTLAGIVLVITSLLVSMPSPRRPGEAPPGPGAAPAADTTRAAAGDSARAASPADTVRAAAPADTAVAATPVDTPRVASPVDTAGAPGRQ